MPEPYIGEIRMFAGNFAPNGWMFCEGQTLPISENDALFTLIGTTYGGDGQETFNLPNLASRVPIHMGNGPSGTNSVIGEMAGTEQETLTVQQIPNHSHPFTCSTDNATGGNPANQLLGQSASVQVYLEDAPNVSFAANAALPAGGSQPHENSQPFLCINFIISLFGVFPQQT
jgi:microcystin-dependent protein